MEFTSNTNNNDNNSNEGREWWEETCLRSTPEGLTMDGVLLSNLAIEHGTPLYVYSSLTILARLNILKQTLASTGAASFRINYAMKANRYAGVLELIRSQGDVCIDTCSPREVERALSFGFSKDEINVTAGTSFERRDGDCCFALFSFIFFIYQNSLIYCLMLCRDVVQ